MTLAFYKALHAVDSYLAKLDIHLKGHRKRIEEAQKKGLIVSIRSILRYTTPAYKHDYEEDTYQDKPEDVMMLVNGSRRIEDYINSLLEAH